MMRSKQLEELFVTSRGPTTDSTSSAIQTEDFLMTLEGSGLLSNNQEEKIKASQPQNPLEYNNQRLDCIIPPLPKSEGFRHQQISVLDHSFDLYYNPFSHSSFTRPDDITRRFDLMAEQSASPNVEPKEEVATTPKEETDAGTLVLCSGTGNEKVIGKLELNSNVYNNPYRVHQQIKKVVLRQIRADRNTPPEPIKEDDQDDPLRWRPLSILDLYHSKVPGPDVVSHNSCFGKINMRLKRAWTRGPNKKKYRVHKPKT